MKWKDPLQNASAFAWVALKSHRVQSFAINQKPNWTTFEWYSNNIWANLLDPSIPFNLFWRETTREHVPHLELYDCGHKVFSSWIFTSPSLGFVFCPLHVSVQPGLVLDEITIHMSARCVKDILLDQLTDLISGRDDRRKAGSYTLETIPLTTYYMHN